MDSRRWTGPEPGTAPLDRRAAGLGMRSATPSGWDLATAAVSLCALLLLLGHVLRVFA